jgi:NADPH-dependent 7-cyano-7-deazaguanine reductase QueF
MDNKDIKPDGKITPEQEGLVGQLTEDEVHEIDMALLSNTNDKWRKVAMVVAKTMLELPCRISGIPDIYYSQRIRRLVVEKKLIARGDLSYMRYSEVRKPVNEC